MIGPEPELREKLMIIASTNYTHGALAHHVEIVEEVEGDGPDKVLAWASVSVHEGDMRTAGLLAVEELERKARYARSMAVQAGVLDSKIVSTLGDEGVTVKATELLQVAEQYSAQAGTWERAGNAEMARQMRTIQNLLCAIAQGRQIKL